MSRTRVAARVAALSAAGLASIVVHAQPAPAHPVTTRFRGLVRSDHGRAMRPSSQVCAARLAAMSTIWREAALPKP